MGFERPMKTDETNRVLPMHQPLVGRTCRSALLGPCPLHRSERNQDPFLNRRPERGLSQTAAAALALKRRDILRTLPDCRTRCELRTTRAPIPNGT